MSGGVDSSAAAALLLKQGFRVVGATMNLMGLPPAICARSAVLTAKKLGIEHHIIDLKDYFNRTVVEDFITEYRTGRTPNPCVRCNAQLKWGALWDKMEQLSLDFIATGHYAQVKSVDGYQGLFRAANTSKDQSYALWKISLRKLERTIFPLGAVKGKDEVCRIAKELDLPAAETSESQEICFIVDDDYVKFLQNKGVKSSPGDLVSSSGEVIGRHQGYINYTVGQRKGLGGGFDQPMYVHSIDSRRNRVHIGPRRTVISREITASEVNWLVKPIPGDSFEAEVKIRYKDPGRRALVIPSGGDNMNIRFPQGVEAAAPGQSAVVYVGDRLIAGGVIDTTSNEQRATSNE